MSIEDVTDRVKNAVQPNMSAEDANKARANVMAQIEKESREKTGLRSDVVTLYQGGQFHLYRYKRYDDVRLVFAPEEQIAFYGGDPDNFEYPRFDLDICIFRAYENGKPAKIDNYLNWNTKGPAKVLPTYNYFEQFRARAQASYRPPRAFYSTLFEYARRLLRHGDEMTKPNGERFPEFRDSYKESLELELFSSHPIHDDYEIVKLTDSLTDMVERFGTDDPLVKQVLAGKSPVDRDRKSVV